MSYTKTDMLSHKIIEILKEHSDEKHPLTQQQICGYLEEMRAAMFSSQTMTTMIMIKAIKNTSQIFTTPLTSPLRNMSFWQTASYTRQCSLRTM